ncbi:MAG: hypothetical protein EHM13_08640, partial [Acidobacteria bacterium]
KQLEKERDKRKAADLAALADLPETKANYEKWKKLDDRHKGLVAIQKHLSCEGYLPEKRVADGNLNWEVGIAVELFQRRNFLMPNATIDAETRAAFALDSKELDFRFALRVLRERVADAAGLVEDGTAGEGPVAILGRMLDHGAFERDPVSTLRAVLFAGEVMPPSWAARLRAAYPRTELWNLYGPTETNVVTAYRLGAQVHATKSVPIGHACPYARLRLLSDADERHEGARTGELLVGGTSLMSGYWGRTEETSRALVRLDDVDGVARAYYRTGDRVAENGDGTLSFVGRMDRQVKRRGVRIELAEIEAVLAGAPGVAEAAAVSAEGEGATTIAAFVAARAGAQVEALTLRAHCATLLPSYMMPDEINQVARLPRGSRGKVDYEVLRGLRGRSV